MQETAILDSGASWRRLGLSLLIGSVGNVGMWAIIVIMPAVQAEFGIDRADASMPYVLTMIGFALGNLLIGRAVDRWSVTQALWGSAALVAVGFALAALTANIWTFALLHLVIGLGTAASFGPLIADLSHWFLKRRGIAVAVAASGNYLSGAIWPFVLGGLLQDQGWRAVYLSLAVIVGIGVPLLALGLRAKVPEAPPKPPRVRPPPAAATPVSRRWCWP